MAQAQTRDEYRHWTNPHATPIQGTTAQFPRCHAAAGTAHTSSSPIHSCGKNKSYSRNSVLQLPPPSLHEASNQDENTYTFPPRHFQASSTKLPDLFPPTSRPAPSSYFHDPLSGTLRLLTTQSDAPLSESCEPSHGRRVPEGFAITYLPEVHRNSLTLETRYQVTSVFVTAYYYR